MIRLGLGAAEKAAIVSDYCRSSDVNRIVILTPPQFDFPFTAPPGVTDGVPCERVNWDDIIRYKFFYRLLREIDRQSLVVVNECLRTQERSCLTYNCIRHYLQQAGHQIVFQYLPIIDQPDDFMIVLDFDTRSRWRRMPFDPAQLPEQLRGVDMAVRPAAPSFQALSVPTTAKQRAAYEAEREKLFSGLGLKDPHTLPRNLHLVSGRAKLGHIDPGRWYVARNNRFKLANLVAFKEANYPDPCIAFDFPHNFIDMADFLCLSGQEQVPALVSDLRVDQWYFERYVEWGRRVKSVISALQR